MTQDEVLIACCKHAEIALDLEPDEAVKRLKTWCEKNEHEVGLLLNRCLGNEPWGCWINETDVLTADTETEAFLNAFYAAFVEEKTRGAQ